MNPALPDFSRICMDASETLAVARHLGIDTPTVYTFRDGACLVHVTLPGFTRPSTIRIPAPAKETA